MKIVPGSSNDASNEAAVISKIEEGQRPGPSSPHNDDDSEGDGAGHSPGHRSLKEQEVNLRQTSPFQAYTSILPWGLVFYMIPGFIAPLGWTLGMIALLWAWGHSLVTGHMLASIDSDLPDILSYPELGGYVVSRLLPPKRREMGYSVGFWSVWLLQVVGNFLTSAVNIAFVAEFLQEIFQHLCYSYWVMIAYFIAMVITLIPTFHGSFLLNTTSIVVLLVLFGLLISEVVNTGRLEDVSYEVESVGSALGGLAGMAFAFGGHSIYPEVQREMKEPKKFSQSISWTYATLATLEFSFGALGYFYFGDQASVNIMNNIKTSGSFIPAAVLQLITMMSLLLISNIIFMMSIQTVLQIPLKGWSAPRSYGMPVGLTRFLLRAFLLSCELLLVYAIPFISDIAGLAGSVAYSMLTFGFPPVAYLVVKGDEVSFMGKVACVAMIAVSLFVAGAGTYGSVVSILSDSKAYPPFQLPCDASELP